MCSNNYLSPWKTKRWPSATLPGRGPPHFPVPCHPTQKARGRRYTAWSSVGANSRMLGRGLIPSGKTWDVAHPPPNKYIIIIKITINLGGVNSFTLSNPAGRRKPWFFKGLSVGYKWGIGTSRGKRTRHRENHRPRKCAPPHRGCWGSVTSGGWPVD